MRLQRVFRRWKAACQCGARIDSNMWEARRYFIAYLQRRGWSEDAKGKPLCPACAKKAKGETIAC